MAPLFPVSLPQSSAMNSRQDLGPTTGMQNESMAARGLNLSPAETLGFCADVLGVLQFAGIVLLRPYASSCPNKGSLKELSEILSLWKGVLNDLDPEQKARFEVDRPGEFDSMMRAISEYEDHLENFGFDFRQSTLWARYMPRTQLSQAFKKMSGQIRTLDREYRVTTKNYRKTNGNQAGTGPANDSTVPAPDTTLAVGNTDDVEMVPIPTNAAADERRLINQYTIEQTERYRNILRVYANYNVPPALQSTYSAIQNFVTSLLARPENSVVMLPPV